MNKQPISISLFSGAFGLDLGLEQAGYRTVSVVEVDPHAAKTIAANRPELAGCAVARDIRTLTPEELLREGGVEVGEVDLVSGGPPCQSFSTAGKRQAFGDPRGSLFMDFLRMVAGIRPRFFIMENVRGLLSAQTEAGPKGSALEVVLQEMASTGYRVIYRLLEAADYGVPQSRQRVIFLGSRDNETLTFPAPSHSKGGAGLPPWLTLREAIGDLHDPSPEYPPYSEARLRYLRLLTAGQNWKHLPPELQPEAMGGAYDSGGGKVGFYRRLAWDKHSPTITTSPSQKSTDMCHPEELRPLSVKECARIQTFPDDWVFQGPLSARYKQIGNAVPVLLGRALGEQLLGIGLAHRPAPVCE